jgi:hypothetical protein
MMPKYVNSAWHVLNKNKLVVEYTTSACAVQSVVVPLV